MSSQFKTLFTFISICCAIVQCNVLLAISFSTEIEWQNNSGNFSIETFDSLITESSLAVMSLPSLGIAFERLNDSSSFPTLFPRNQVGGNSVSEPFVLLNDSNLSLPGLGSINFLPVNSTKPITAVGYWNTGQDDATQLRLFDNMGNLLESADSATGLSFIGIVSNTPVARVEIGSVGGNGLFTIDNLQVSTIPEPTTVMLILTGIVFILVYRQLTSTE